jgi:hypothetical protein
LILKTILYYVQVYTSDTLAHAGAPNKLP